MPQSPFRDDRESAAARVARLEAENAALRMHAFTALDWLGLLAAALVVAAVGLYLPLIVRPRFVAMFADFGGPLPVVTRLVVRPWFLPLVATRSRGAPGCCRGSARVAPFGPAWPRRRGLRASARSGSVLGLGTVCPHLRPRRCRSCGLSSLDAAGLWTESSRPQTESTRALTEEAGTRTRVHAGANRGNGHADRGNGHTDGVHAGMGRSVGRVDRTRARKHLVNPCIDLVHPWKGRVTWLRTESMQVWTKETCMRTESTRAWMEETDARTRPAGATTLSTRLWTEEMPAWIESLLTPRPN